MTHVFAIVSSVQGEGRPGDEAHERNYIRLNFTLLDEDEIRLGIKLMAAQIKDMLGVGPGA